MPESTASTAPETETISTGNSGLDDILGGGFDANRVYLIEGHPGTGKTTLALQFLLEGIRLGERCLYVTLSESESELRAVVTRHGWTLAGIDVYELVPPEASLDPDQELTLFHPAEMELSETTRNILDRVRAINPKRVVFDSLSEMRLLSQNSLRYRRQILALKNFSPGGAARSCCSTTCRPVTRICNCTALQTASSRWSSSRSTMVPSAGVSASSRCGA
jgi:circadian clock protein KaiC